MWDLQQQLSEARTENKLLKRLQHRHMVALQHFQDSEGSLSQVGFVLLVSHCSARFQSLPQKHGFCWVLILKRQNAYICVNHASYIYSHLLFKFQKLFIGPSLQAGVLYNFPALITAHFSTHSSHNLDATPILRFSPSTTTRPESCRSCFARPAPAVTVWQGSYRLQKASC